MDHGRLNADRHRHEYEGHQAFSDIHNLWPAYYATSTCATLRVVAIRCGTLRLTTEHGFTPSCTVSLQSTPPGITPCIMYAHWRNSRRDNRTQRTMVHCHTLLGITWQLHASRHMPLHQPCLMCITIHCSCLQGVALPSHTSRCIGMRRGALRSTKQNVVH